MLAGAGSAVEDVIGQEVKMRAAGASQTGGILAIRPRRHAGTEPHVTSTGLVNFHFLLTEALLQTHTQPDTASSLFAIDPVLVRLKPKTRMANIGGTAHEPCQLSGPCRAWPGLSSRNRNDQNQNLPPPQDTHAYASQAPSGRQPGSQGAKDPAAYCPETVNGPSIINAGSMVMVEATDNLRVVVRGRVLSIFAISTHEEITRKSRGLVGHSAWRPWVGLL
ncbi:hypothetical protein E4U53_006209 [Claviceps sorghi]|nr:hypothetical protein E4U53_006209 [Claviceps sorghi]